MSKYDQMLKNNQEPEGKVWDRYGLSESEWSALTTEQREVHYARQAVCDHPYEYKGIETEPGVFHIREDWSLREEYSHDPYFHTPHMFSCRKKTDSKCDCQMCANKIGIERCRFKPPPKTDGR